MGGKKKMPDRKYVLLVSPKGVGPEWWPRVTNTLTEAPFARIRYKWMFVGDDGQYILWPDSASGLPSNEDLERWLDAGDPVNYEGIRRRLDEWESAWFQIVGDNVELTPALKKQGYKEGDDLSPWPWQYWLFEVPQRKGRS